MTNRMDIRILGLVWDADPPSSPFAETPIPKLPKPLHGLTVRFWPADRDARLALDETYDFAGPWKGRSLSFQGTVSGFLSREHRRTVYSARVVTQEGADALITALEDRT